MHSIDARILVSKTAEMSKEQTRLLKQDQLQAEQAHALAERRLQQELKRTPAAGKAKGGRIAADDGRGGAQYDADSFERSEEEYPEEPPGDMAHLPAEREEQHTIDIVV